jgi:hypothetical protein
MKVYEKEDKGLYLYAFQPIRNEGLSFFAIAENIEGAREAINGLLEDNKMDKISDCDLDIGSRIYNITIGRNGFAIANKNYK